jgi:HlyD family secretion protein
MQILKRGIWALLVISVLGTVSFIIVKLVIPSFKSPLSRMYYTSLGYPALLRRRGTPIPVAVGMVERGTIAEIITSAGHTVSENLVYVNSKIIGEIEKIHVAEGSVVKRGDLLVELDKTPFENQLIEARSALEIARASLEATTSGERTEIIKKNEIAVDRAQKILEITENRYQREKKLFDQGLTSEPSLEDYEKEYLDAMATLQASQKELEKSRSGRSEEIDVAMSKLNASRSRLKVAKENLDATQIYSPIDGIIIERKVNRGEITGGIHKHMLVIASGILFKANVDQEKAGKVCVNQEATVTLSAHPGIKFQGKVVKISPATILYDQDVTFNVNVPITFPVWIEFSLNTGHVPSLISGMTGFTQIHIRRDVLTVASAALIHFSGSEGLVFIVNDEKAHLRRVVFGLTEDGRTEIISGLHRGERVVVAGQNALIEGDSVDIRTKE